MTILDCTVDAMGGRWLPAALTTDHPRASDGQPVLILDGQPLSPLDLIKRLRPAADGHPHPERFAVLVRIAGSGPPVYYHWHDQYTVAPARLGHTELDSPYQQAVGRAAADLRQAAESGPPLAGVTAADLADATATMIRAIGASTGKAPQPVEEWRVAYAPEDYVAFCLTDEEWAITRTAERIGYLVHAAAADAIDLIQPARMLRAGRTRLDLSQAALGAALSVNANTISRWERGDAQVAHPRMLRLALRALPGVLNRVIP